MRLAVTFVVHSGPSWTQIIVPAALGFAGLLLAAWVGARLGARWTREQALALHRTQRQQEALLRFLDLLALVEITIRRSSAEPREPTTSWSEAMPGVGAKMIREIPGVTWVRSDEPDQELYQWGSVAGAVLDTEEQWRDQLRARINRPDISARWTEILETGALMGLKSVAVQGPHLDQLLSKVLALMDKVREST